MKKKELEIFKNKPVVEIDKELRIYEERLGNLKMDLVLGKVKNIREVRHLKKNIAQLLTIKRLK
mgnify:CR=1 FL=1